MITTRLRMADEPEPTRYESISHAIGELLEEGWPVVVGEGIERPEDGFGGWRDPRHLDDIAVFALPGFGGMCEVELPCPRFCCRLDMVCQ